MDVSMMLGARFGRTKDMGDEMAIEVNHLWKKFRLYHEKQHTLKYALLSGHRAIFEEFWALKDIHFILKRGQTLGIIGENGSGKSTLLKILARILRPDKGEVSTRGKVSALLELGAGFHPELSGRENVYLNGSILGLSYKEINQKFDEIVGFAELERFIDMPVKNYSSGMYMRLAFAIAVNVNPDILLIDEILAVGDEAFQRKCLEKMYDYKTRGKTIVFVSHSMDHIRNMCDEVIWLKEGEIQVRGNPNKVVNAYIQYVNLEEQRKGKAQQQVEGSRWGSREIEINRVEFLADGGQSKTLFETGEKFIVRINFKAHRKIEKPVFGIRIDRADGVCVTRPNTKLNNVFIDSVQGEGTIEYVVDSLPLLPGSYLVTAAIYDYHCLHSYDHHEQLYEFQVTPGREKESYGVVKIPGRWSMIEQRDSLAND